MSWQPEVDELHRREELAKLMGGEWVRDAYALLPEQLGPYQHAMRP